MQLGVLRCNALLLNTSLPTVHLYSRRSEGILSTDLLWLKGRQPLQGLQPL